MYTFIDLFAGIGVVVNPETHEVGIDTADNVSAPCEWYSCDTLTKDGEA